MSKNSILQTQNNNVKKELTTDEKIYKTLSILSDILFFPFLIIILLCSSLMLSAKNHNEVPSVFGYSAVRILSGSMEPDFKVNQVVLVKKINTDTLQIGDIIAFYEYIGTDDTDESSNPTPSAESNVSINFLTFLGAGVSTTSGQSKKYSDVIFHRIVDIRTGIGEYEGKLFFQTKGDANASADSAWILEDYVVGKLYKKNSAFAGLLNFCTNVGGIFLFIIIPSLTMIGMLLYEIIVDYKKQVKVYTTEKNEDALGDTEKPNILNINTMNEQEQKENKHMENKQKIDKKPIKPINEKKQAKIKDEKVVVLPHDEENIAENKQNNTASLKPNDKKVAPKPPVPPKLPPKKPN